MKLENWIFDLLTHKDLMERTNTIFLSWHAHFKYKLNIFM